MSHITGTIISVKDSSTAKVQVVTTYTHPLYKKVLKMKRAFLCHIAVDVASFVQIGKEVVIISAGRKLSKKKSFFIQKVL